MSVQGEAAPHPTRLGRYELITKIGHGGMAEVQLALQRGPAGFEKLVVVKLVHDSLATQKAFVDMLLDEARVAALVKHPNVVDIYDLGQADGRYFIAMEYLEGEPLLAVLRAGREGKRLDPLSTGRLIADTAEGLDAAHELRSMAGERIELVHHDISLGNIVVLYSGQVKLVDFGVAKASQNASGPGAKVQGKLSYMAPEKLRGQPGDRRSDIFSLGCVMWEALTLKRLFRGDSEPETIREVLELAIQPPSKINGDVPPGYDPIVMRALDRDPARRYPTAKAFAVEIEELLRRRGYGAKNDRIAKYMQETFRSHIDARQKLVQEVVSQGSASAEVVDAAFRQPLFASGSPVTSAASGDLSGRYRRPTFELPLPATVRAAALAGKPAAAPAARPAPAPAARPAAAPAARPALARAAKPAPPTPSAWDLNGETVLSPPPVMDEGDADDLDADDGDAETTVAAPGDPGDPDDATVTTPAGAPVVPGDRSHALIDRLRPTARAVVTRGRAVLAHPRQRLIAAGAAGVLLIIVIAIAVSGGGGGDGAGHGSAALVAAAPAASPDATAADGGADEADGAPATVPDEAAAGSGLAAVGSGHAAAAPSNGTRGIVLDPAGDPAGVAHEGHGASGAPEPAGHDHHAGHPEHHAEHHVDRAGAEGLYRNGLQAYVRGDNKAALGYLQKARAANPGFAPTWRVLGKVYEKLGEHGAAKNAYLRYLQLAPRAADAAQIRTALNHL